MSWDDIDRAVVEISRISVEHGVPGMRKIEADRNLAAVKDAHQLDTDQELSAIEEEARMVDSSIEDCIEALTNNSPSLEQGRRCLSLTVTDGGASGLGRHQCVIDAGITALQRYGIGPCSARHYYGCFDTYLALEKKLAALYPCLAKQAGKCEGQSLVHSYMAPSSLLVASWLTPGDDGDLQLFYAETPKFQSVQQLLREPKSHGTKTHTHLSWSQNRPLAM